MISREVCALHYAHAKELMETKKIACLVVSSFVVSSALALGCSVKADDPPAPIVASPPPAPTTDKAHVDPHTNPPPAPPAPAASEEDAGADGESDAAPPPKKDVAACVAACEAKYPNGAAKAAMIDQCWNDNCGSCQGMAPGPAQLPADGSQCENPVYTPSADCSKCTVDACCWAWDGCFGDDECKSLNACADQCWK
jgi:hypothetical protein